MKWLINYLLLSHKKKFSWTEESNESGSNKKKYMPHGILQEQYVKELLDPSVKIVAGIGPAGTGKTLFACDTAINLLRQQNVTKIVLTRPMIAVENENIGFLPGDIACKMNPWLLPIFDIFLEYYTRVEIDKKIFDGTIEICPLGYMRGRTFKNAIIIADEIQNSTPQQLLMVATRLGKNSKLMITGDLNQSDLKVVNGLEFFVKRMKTSKTFDDIRMVEFSNRDIERSAVVRHVLELFDVPS